VPEFVKLQPSLLSRVLHETAHHRLFIHHASHSALDPFHLISTLHAYTATAASQRAFVISFITLHNPIYCCKPSGSHSHDWRNRDITNKLPPKTTHSWRNISRPRMPLITKLHPALERVREHSGSGTLDADTEEHFDHELDDFQERNEEDMSDGSILDQPRLSKTSIPAVPPRSELRASRIFENLTIELEALEKAANEEKNKEQSVESDPYASYLSSEEEGSESTDEFDESIVQLDSDRPPSSTSSRCSHEDTARVVSFMFVGKPQLVDVASHERPASLKRRSTDRSDKSEEPRRRPSPLRLIPSNTTGSSTISTRKSSLSVSTRNLPLRSYTFPEAAASNISLAGEHSFLQSDPFAKRNSQEVEKVSSSSDAYPKTPVGVADQWKGSILGMTKSLSKAAKRKASIPKLSLSYTSTVTLPTSSPTPTTATPISVSSPMPRPSQDQGPVFYKDILRNVIREPPPASPKLKTSRSNLLGIGRRKSIKG
jgi:hypothetical protein